MVDYDWKNADEHYRLAMETEPVKPQVRMSYAGYYLSALGRFEEALQELDKVMRRTRSPLQYTRPERRSARLPGCGSAP
jgi:Tfp pilus assembly protein PilF